MEERRASRLPFVTRHELPSFSRGLCGAIPNCFPSRAVPGHPIAPSPYYTRGGSRERTPGPGAVLAPFTPSLWYLTAVIRTRWPMNGLVFVTDSFAGAGARVRFGRCARPNRIGSGCGWSNIKSTRYCLRVDCYEKELVAGDCDRTGAEHRYRRTST